MTPETLQRELRLVAPQLIAEFGGRIDAEVIARIAREEVLLFDRAKVRDFVPIIAWRSARDRLRSGLDRSGMDAHPYVAPRLNSAAG